MSRTNYSKKKTETNVGSKMYSVQESQLPPDMPTEAEPPPESPQLPAVRIWQCPVTLLMLAANVAVFAAMAIFTAGETIFEPSPAVIVDWGGDYGPLTLTGEYWRAFTSGFLHVDVAHLMMNMVPLWIIGRLVETMYGSSKFLFIYLASLLCGSLVSLCIHPTVLSSGASGALFGIFGAFTAASYGKNSAQAVNRWIIVFLLLNLLLSKPGVDIAGHLGGFIGGFLSGLSLVGGGSLAHRWSMRNFVWALLVVAMLILFGIVDVSRFQQISQIHQR